jgi:ribonuclease BN (tRNA processing enzyme)
MSMPRSTIRVTILGSGTCVPSLKRSSCAVLMQTGNAVLLFDSGPGTMRRLLEAGSSIFELTGIFYSHLHPDHTAELVPMLFATKYPDEAARQQPLSIVAGRGFNKFFRGLEAVYGKWILLPPGIVNIVELDNRTPDVHRLGDVEVKSAPVVHNEESIAFRVTNAAGCAVVYSGDTDFSEDLIELARDADLLICESALPDDMRVPGHLTPSLAGEIATRAGVKKLVLTHFYPPCDQVDIVRQCRKTYSGPLLLAEDLMQIEVKTQNRQ